MQLLTQHGADVDGGCGHGKHQKPVTAAIQGRQAAALQLLIKAGATVEQEELVLAARLCETGELVTFLLGMGIQDTEDRALVAAAMSFQPSWPVVQLLLFSSRGHATDTSTADDLHARLMMVAYAAAGQSHFEIVQKLLALLPAPGSKDASVRPMPALDLVLRAAAGALQQFTHPIYGWSVKFSPSSSSFYQPQDRHNVIALLVQLGANVNANRNSALRAAVNAHDRALVKFLWEQGANGKGHDGELIGSFLVPKCMRPPYSPQAEQLLQILQKSASS
jgi:hypothetical protein